MVTTNPTTTTCYPPVTTSKRGDLSAAAPGSGGSSGDSATGETGGEQVAAGRRFPVEHLAGAEHAGARSQHQVLVKLGHSYAAGGADRFVQWARSKQSQRQRLDRSRQLQCIV